MMRLNVENFMNKYHQSYFFWFISYSSLEIFQSIFMHNRHFNTKYTSEDETSKRKTEIDSCSWEWNPSYLCLYYFLHLHSLLLPQWFVLLTFTCFTNWMRKYYVKKKKTSRIGEEGLNVEVASIEGWMLHLKAILSKELVNLLGRR